MRSNGIKRTIDFVGSLAGLIILSPVLACVSAAIALTMGRPIFFRQTRPGFGGAPFLMIKFRTMLEQRAGESRTDQERLTRLGKFLRSTSIDELPELLNVLRGDMSLVGPRPLLVRYLDRYTPEQARRHLVKPGITGWAQINGRNSLTWESKFACDVWYVDHWTNGLDLKILLVTLLKVVKRDGISADGHATMPEFQGMKEVENEKAA